MSLWIKAVNSNSDDTVWKKKQRNTFADTLLKIQSSLRDAQEQEQHACNPAE